MAQVTPPPSSPREHRRARSTPQRVSPDSSGDETSFMSPGAPSIPSSPVESRGGVTVPSTPLSPPLDDPFMPVHPEETVSSTSSRPGSSSREEESAAFEAYVRAGRSEKIDAGNAQAKLTPEACLFVASLRKDKPDREIHAALVEEFRRYGTCYIKVKRNGEIPIAFVQYHGKNNANIAMECATGASILERPCRIEKARAPRSVFVSRRDGRTPSRAEVLQLLQKVGEVDKVWAISELERERFALPPGFGCRFAFYQDSVDAITVGPHHSQPVDLQLNRRSTIATIVSTMWRTFGRRKGTPCPPSPGIASSQSRIVRRTFPASMPTSICGMLCGLVGFRQASASLRCCGSSPTPAG
ncbi:Multicopy suppressor of sporulation protein msa1 [Diplodia seriata]|uniref:Multicopy suppressor of sporulation protein msa1 n=1 Tax=Diplodia seriata TaxID=420778 RepID=A0A1S8BMR9_9PEZI|nr:Multicopy suppressor of sporulation protein msa1 [Diplodia seriata]